MLRKKLGKDPAKTTTTTADVIKPPQIKSVINFNNQNKNINNPVQLNKPIVGIQKTQTTTANSKANVNNNLLQNKQIKPIFAKTQEEKLAQIVSRKAAQLKKQSQLINKISSQVGTQKKNRLKQYKGVWAHVLNNIKQKKQNKQKQNKQNQQVEVKNSIYETAKWKDQVQKYLVSNFKVEAYM